MVQDVTTCGNHDTKCNKFKQHTTKLLQHDTCSEVLQAYCKMIHTDTRHYRHAIDYCKITQHITHMIQSNKTCYKMIRA